MPIQGVGLTFPLGAAMQDIGPLNLVWLEVTEQYFFPSSSIKHTHTFIYTQTHAYIHIQTHLYTLCTHAPKLIHKETHTHTFFLDRSQVVSLVKIQYYVNIVGQILILEQNERIEFAIHEHIK